MRVKAAQVVLLLLCAAPALFAHEELDALKTHADKENEPRLYAQVVRREVEIANDFYTTGDVDKAQEIINELASYTQKCVEAAQAKRSHLKDTELELSKASKRLDDIRKSLNFDDQPPVKAAVAKIEDARRTLLSLMFQDPNKPKHEEKKP